MNDREDAFTRGFVAAMAFYALLSVVIMLGLHALGMRI